MTSPTVEGIKRDIERKKKLISKHKQELDNMVLGLQSLCTHENKYTTEQYHDGGYFDQAYTVYKTKCPDCGLDLGQKIEPHSYYG